MTVHEPKPLHDVNVGAAEGCDLLILIVKDKIKRSQPLAAPTVVKRASDQVIQPSSKRQLPLIRPSVRAIFMSIEFFSVAVALLM
jgi:hypothetical protein